MFAVMAGCATDKGGDKPPSPPPVEPVVEAPAPPPQPVLTPQEREKQAQKLTQEALDQLQHGEEASARGLLEQAVKLDPANELAKKLLYQVNADPQKEWGAQHFRYTVQSGDSLASIAQRFRNDRFLFYLLAKYNDIKVPNRLTVGQTIKVPGRQPPSALLKAPPAPAPLEAVTHKPAEPKTSEPVATPVPIPAPPPAAIAEKGPRAEADRLVAQGKTLAGKGELRQAMTAFDDARKRDPTQPEAARLYESTRKQLVSKLHRDGASLFSKQDLKGAIKKWDEILELEPGDDLAKLKRAQAIELQKKADELGKK